MCCVRLSHFHFAHLCTDLALVLTPWNHTWMHWARLLGKGATLGLILAGVEIGNYLGRSWDVYACLKKTTKLFFFYCQNKISKAAKVWKGGKCRKKWQPLRKKPSKTQNRKTVEKNVKKATKTSKKNVKNIEEIVKRKWQKRPKKRLDLWKNWGGCNPSIPPVNWEWVRGEQVTWLIMWPFIHKHFLLMCWK